MDSIEIRKDQLASKSDRKNPNLLCVHVFKHRRHVAVDPVYCTNCAQVTCRDHSCQCLARQSILHQFEALQIRCRHCKKVMAYKEYLKHAAVVECPQRCGAWLLVDNIAEHIAKRCPHTKCQKCAQKLEHGHSQCVACRALLCHKTDTLYPILCYQETVKSICEGCTKKVPYCPTCKLFTLAKIKHPLKSCICCKAKCCINCWSKCMFCKEHVFCVDCVKSFSQKSSSDCIKCQTSSINKLVFHFKGGVRENYYSYCPICEKCGVCGRLLHDCCLSPCAACGISTCHRCSLKCGNCLRSVLCTVCVDKRLPCRKCGTVGVTSPPFMYSLAFSTYICKFNLATGKYYPTYQLLASSGSSISNVVWTEDNVYFVTKNGCLCSYVPSKGATTAHADLGPALWSCSLQLFHARAIYVTKLRDELTFSKFDLVSNRLHALPNLAIEGYRLTFTVNEHLLVLFNIPADKKTCRIFMMDVYDEEGGWMHFKDIPTHSELLSTVYFSQVSNMELMKAETIGGSQLGHLDCIPLHGARSKSMKRPVCSIFGQYSSCISQHHLYLNSITNSSCRIDLWRLPCAVLT